MIVKDLLPVLPRYSGDYGFNVNFVEVNDKHSKFLWSSINKYDSETGKELPTDKLLNTKVVSIEAGRPRPGGHFDEQLQVYVELSAANGSVAD